MSLPVAPATGGIAPSAAAAVAPAQRAGKTEVQKAAEGFERLLTAQLAKTLVDGATSTEGQSAATGAYAQLLPDALTDALMAGGGIGLARQLEDGLR